MGARINRGLGEDSWNATYGRSSTWAACWISSVFSAPAPCGPPTCSTKAHLARDIGIAPSTANLWLSALEASGQIVLLEPWFSNRTKSIVKSPKLYLADTGLLCALLNVRSEQALADSPSVGAIWETFVFAQLRHRENRAGHRGNLFYWRDRTREVDFLVDRGGRLELFESKWTELPSPGDATNLAFVRDVLGKARVASGTMICRAPNGFPLGNGFRAEPVASLDASGSS